MYYVYHDLTVAGWIALVVFFLFLLGFAWARRLARRDDLDHKISDHHGTKGTKFHEEKG